METKKYLFNPIPDIPINIRGKTYIPHVLNFQTAKTCACYECDFNMDDVKLCEEINCITENEFLYLKEVK